jgi:HEAT repeat protein
MNSDTTRILLLATLLGVVALFTINLLLLGWVRMIRSIRERAARRAAAIASAPLAAYLDGALDLEAAKRRLARGSRDAIAEILCGHARVLCGESLDQIDRLYRALGLAERDRRGLSSRRWWVQLRSAENLGRFTLSGDPAPIVALTRHRRESVRLAAARALARVGSSDAIAHILGLLGKTSTLGVIEVTTILRELGELARAPFREMLEHAVDADVRAIGAELAGETPDPDLLPILLRFTQDPTLEVVIRATRALGAYPDAETGDVLRRLLSHEAWQVRAQAAKALGRIGDATSAHDLAKAMTDSSWWVRYNSAHSLKRLGPVGLGHLRRMRGGSDAYASDMAERVLRLPLAKGAL